MRILITGADSALGRALAAELALPHRLKRGPFSQDEITVTELQERIEQLRGQTDPDDEQESQLQPGGDSETRQKKK